MYNQLIIFHNKNMHKFVPDLFNRKCLDHWNVKLNYIVMVPQIPGFYHAMKAKTTDF